MATASKSSSGAPGSRIVGTLSSPLCECLETPMMMTSWTNMNLGREFYKCVVVNYRFDRACPYFKWVDPEPPHGWQKLALIKAQDKIIALKTELDYYKQLRNSGHGIHVGRNEGNPKVTAEGGSDVVGCMMAAYLPKMSTVGVYLSATAFLFSIAAIICTLKL